MLQVFDEPLLQDASLPLRKHHAAQLIIVLRFVADFCRQNDALLIDELGRALFQPPVLVGRLSLLIDDLYGSLSWAHALNRRLGSSERGQGSERVVMDGYRLAVSSLELTVIFLVKCLQLWNQFVQVIDLIRRY